MHKNTEPLLNTEDSIHSPKKDHGSRHDRPMNIYKFFDDRHQFAIRGERHFFSTTVSSEKGKLKKNTPLPESKWYPNFSFSELSDIPKK